MADSKHWDTFSYQTWLKESRAFGQPGKTRPWIPEVVYTRADDQLRVELADVNSYARWIYPGLTVHLARDTDEVVGVTIEGISKKVQHHALEIKEEAWENDERIITIDGAPVGKTLSKQEAKVVEQWLQSAKGELWTSKSLQETSSKPKSDSSATNATPSPTEEHT